jgi:hypothetical protein
MPTPPPDDVNPNRAGLARFPWGVLGFLAAVYLLSVSGRLPVMDQAVMFSQTRSLIAGHLSITGAGWDHMTPVGVGGQHYSQYGVLVSVLWIPPTLVMRTVAAAVHGVPLKMLEEFAASFVNVAAMLGILAYLAESWRRSGVPSARIRGGLLAMGLGTLLWAYAKMPFSDPWMALGLFAGYCHWRWRGLDSRHVFFSGFWLGVALLSRKQAQLMVPVLGAAMAWEVWRTAEGRRDLLRLALTLVPAALLQGLYNYGRFGNPLLEVYPYVEGGAPLGVAGLARNFLGILIDPFNGFVPYNVFVIGLAAVCWRWWRADPLGAALPWLLLAASSALMCRYYFWSGGLCFGSRYLLFVIPFAALALPHLPVSPGPWRWGLGLALTAGVLVQLAGVMIDPLAVSLRREFVSGSTTSVPRLYAAEMARVLGISEPVLNEAGRTSAYAVHPAFQVPDLWWAHVIYELRHRGATASKGALPSPAKGQP